MSSPYSLLVLALENTFDDFHWHRGSVEGCRVPHDDRFGGPCPGASSPSRRGVTFLQCRPTDISFWQPHIRTLLRRRFSLRA